MAMKFHYLLSIIKRCSEVKEQNVEEHLNKLVKKYAIHYLTLLQWTESMLIRML